MAANHDVLHTDEFAWDNHLLFHTGPSNSPECSNLGQAARNEITRQNLTAQFRAQLKTDLQAAATWPRTAIFRVRDRVALGNYDSGKGSFPVQPHGIVSPRAKLKIPRTTTERQSAQMYYQGPAKQYCLTRPPNVLTTFSLDLLGSDKIRELPVARAEAETFIGEVGAPRYITLELLVETEASIPIKNPTVPGNVIAARALHPKTGAVLYNYDVFLTSSPAAPADSTLTSNTAPLTACYAALILLRDNPQLLTGERPSRQPLTSRFWRNKVRGIRLRTWCPNRANGRRVCQDRGGRPA